MLLLIPAFWFVLLCTCRYIKFCSIIFNKIELHQFARNHRITCHNTLSGYYISIWFSVYLLVLSNHTWLVDGAFMGSSETEVLCCCFCCLFIHCCLGRTCICCKFKTCIRVILVVDMIENKHAVCIQSLDNYQYCYDIVWFIWWVSLWPGMKKNQLQWNG